MPLRIAFIHPDLGLGGAERLVVDAALGLQALGHQVDIYTSHHDPKHCFEETRDGTLRVHYVRSPFPRSVRGKFHILCAHARQLHLTRFLTRPGAPEHDVYFVDQLSTCVPILRLLARRRVLFYCHFPDKLLANGAYVEGKMTRRGSVLKRAYRYPMDWLEERTTGSADIILANSKFTSRVFKAYFPSIPTDPRVVYPGVNLAAYAPLVGDAAADPDIISVASPRPTLMSLNRFEKKKNHALAVDTFATLIKELASQGLSSHFQNPRLVIAGGYDPRVEDNMMTLVSLIDRAKAHALTYTIIKPSVSPVTIPPFNTTPSNPDVVFLLNFTMAQRAALLNAPSTLALLYTPANEHFGIGPVEGMACARPVIACNSGGPTETLVDSPPEARTGWLLSPEPELWARALVEIVRMPAEERAKFGERSQARARSLFGMDAMARSLEEALEEAAAMGPVPTPASLRRSSEQMGHG
ncbi:alpha-1,3-mannosyltransferase ALG2 [Amylostereum chailletii]|nr:alpha-1,3-mannosyltransferase ALG2 [Amylostereum chailletii]